MTTQQSNRKRLHAIIRGHVQGVGFRHNTRMTARRLNINGWVRNNPDGTVEVVAEGLADAFDEFEDFLRSGPRAARVQSIDIDWESPTGEFDRFKVRYA